MSCAGMCLGEMSGPKRGQQAGMGRQSGVLSSPHSLGFLCPAFSVCKWVLMAIGIQESPLSPPPGHRWPLLVSCVLGQEGRVSASQSCSRPSSQSKGALINFPACPFKAWGRNQKTAIQKKGRLSGEVPSSLHVASPRWMGKEWPGQSTGEEGPEVWGRQAASEYPMADQISTASKQEHFFSPHHRSVLPWCLCPTQTGGEETR